MEIEVEHKTLTFREVHAELEQESMLLQKEHNINDFTLKSKFLNGIGFIRSKATLMYQAIVDSKPYLDRFSVDYGGAYKFILKEQLMRVCEKYNLFVRSIEHFAGDIPEKNIQDMMNFRAFLKDLFIPDDQLMIVYLAKIGFSVQGFDANTKPFLLSKEYQKIINRDRERVLKNFYSFLDLNELGTSRLQDIPELMGSIRERIANKLFDGNMETYVRSIEWKNMPDPLSYLEIAAVPSLFAAGAWEKGNERILSQEQLQATGQVDLDPIVMLRNPKGYIIITAWGDEANDELVVNQNMN